MRAISISLILLALWLAMVAANADRLDGKYETCLGEARIVSDDEAWFKFNECLHELEHGEYQTFRTLIEQEDRINNLEMVGDETNDVIVDWLSKIEKRLGALEANE